MFCKLNSNMSSFARNRRWMGALIGGMLAVSVSMASAAEPLVRFANGEAISQEDFSAYLDKRVDLRSSTRNVWGVEAALRDMALGRVLMLEGERLGEPRRTGKEGERFDDVYSFAIYKKLTPACEPPADAAAARKFFDEHPKVFQVPPMARLSRIMLPAAESVDGAPVMDWLLAQAQAIASGGTSFAKVVERADSVYQIDPQGDIGWVALVEEHSILRVLASARQGELVGPVREGDFGYLFHIVAKRESRQLAWDEVAVSVPTRIVNFCRQQANEQLREDLFKKYGVVLDQAAIKGLFVKPEVKK